MLVDTRLTTDDGVTLAAHHDPGPDSGDRPGPDALGIVLAHGFTGSWRRPAVRRVASVLGEFGGVVSFDFRGHGRSGGHSTVGHQEVRDVTAAVGWARELGYARVVTVGFSMGAAVVVRHAGLTKSVAAVAAVSGPSRWYYRGTVAMRRVHWVLERPVGRLVGRVALRTRISPQTWPEPAPEPPYVLAARIAPVPLLVVHGDADDYFPVEHAETLFAAAREPKQLWIEPGLGHAENAVTPELVRRIGAWLAAASS